MMEKRTFLPGIETSLLGFGCMRFPLLADGRIDEAQAEQMLDLAYSSGVNYFDTAYPYHNGESEPLIGRILKKYDREKIFVATKLPLWEVETIDDAARIFDEQLTRLDLDYVDFYLLHALNKERFEAAKKLDLFAYLEKLKAAGKIRRIGFSFHDDYEVFEEIIHFYDWEFCQIQFNYMDTEFQAGLKGYELAAGKGIPVIVMEPVKGGALAALPGEAAKPLLDQAPDKSIASWAMRFVGSFPGIKVILSGMSSMEQVTDNLCTFSPFRPLSAAESRLIEDTARTMKERVKNGCTGCRYCMPCPAGVDIPRNFKIWNEYGVFDNIAKAKREYFTDLPETARAGACVKCGKCEAECPQGIPIRRDLQQVKVSMGQP